MGRHDLRGGWLHHRADEDSGSVSVRQREDRHAHPLHACARRPGPMELHEHVDLCADHLQLAQGTRRVHRDPRLGFDRCQVIQPVELPAR